jgi:hypothetical protein
MFMQLSGTVCCASSESEDASGHGYTPAIFSMIDRTSGEQGAKSARPFVMRLDASNLLMTQHPMAISW